MKGMGGHQSAAMGKDEWITPREILMPLGRFALDPCSPVNPPWPIADHYFTLNDDGLSQQWKGRVWLNPPYGEFTAHWLEKLANHGDGIALVFARTETEMFFTQVWPKADAILFIEGRLYFHHISGARAKANAGAPSVLIAYGKQNAEILRTCGLRGKFIYLKK